MSDPLDFLKRSASLSVCALIFWASPGAGLYQALAQEVRAARPASAVLGARTYAPVFGGALAAGPLRGAGLSSSLALASPGVRTPLAGYLPEQASLVSVPAAAGATPVSAAGVPARDAALEAGVLRAPAKEEARRIAGKLSAALDGLGPVAQAQPSAAYALGHQIVGWLTRGPAFSSSEAELAPRAGGLSALSGRTFSSPGRSFGWPAGRSISDAAQSHTPGPPPPAKPPDQGENPGGGWLKWIAKLAAAALPLAPMLLVGVPLSRQNPMVHGVFMHAGLALMAFPFIARPGRVWKWVRSVPGVLVFATGALAAGSGLAAGAPSAAMLGGVLAVAGLGLLLYARMSQGPGRQDRLTFAVHLAAVLSLTAAGLALLKP